MPCHVAAAAPLPPLPPSPPPRPPWPPSAIPYKYIGCYKDLNAAAHRLPVVLISAQLSSTVDVDECRRAAAAQRLLYFGVQDGEQCYGGSDLALARSQGPATSCSTPCKANAQQLCGGRNANNIYQVNLQPRLRPLDAP